ncbi:MAG: hypothetical protein EOP60_07230 [Sphingomonadales bacterium]|nr:MAG: hypothetical protein EOP60_07230 [Sphingomonadales bacterium]
MLARAPVYLMIKPDSPTACEIARRRPLFGIDSRYGSDRLHATVLPLGDYPELEHDFLDEVLRIVASLRAEPFWVAFDRLNGNALRGSKSLAAFRAQIDRAQPDEVRPAPPALYFPAACLAYLWRHDEPLDRDRPDRLAGRGTAAGQERPRQGPT